MKKLPEYLLALSLKLEDASQERLESSYYYRGKFISNFSMLESSMEMFLRTYFMGKSVDWPKNYKQVDFSYIILERMTFEAKRTSIKTITENLAKSKGFKKTKSNGFPQNKLLDEIRQLNDYRIYFAHYIDVIMSDKNGLLDYVIALHERRDSKKKRMYNLSQFNELIDRIKSATGEIDELTKQLLMIIPT